MRGLILPGAVLALVAAGVLLTVNYEAWVTTPKLTQQKRAFVTQQMRDPVTVQFKDERLNKKGWLCGQLNSKNAYGAYVGFRRFVALDDDAAWIEGLGYAGKPEANESARIMELLQAQIQVSEQILVAVKADPKFPRPSEREVIAVAEHELFAGRWTKHCS